MAIIELVIIPGQPSRVVNLFCHPHHGGCGLFTQVQFSPGVYDYSHTCLNCGKTYVINVNLPPQGVALLPRQSVHAFGDESSYGDVIGYGLVVIHAHNLLAAEQLLSGLKRRYAVDPQAEFHCRIVFNGHQKRKSPWKNLSESQVLDFAEELILGLGRLPAAFVVGAVHRNEYPAELPAVGKVPASEMGTKQVAGMACWSALMTLRQNFGPDEIKFLSDPDRVKVPFFGRRIQAHTNYKLAFGEASQHILPEPFDEKDKPALLQAADLFAYTATHALTDKAARNKGRFERWYKISGPATGFWGVSDESVYSLQDPVQEIEGFEPSSSRLEARHAELIAA